MTTRNDPLQHLQERAEDATQDAMRHLAELLKGCKQSESRLSLLERYRDEYRAKLDDAAKRGVSAAELNNFRAFLSRLEEALNQQRADLNNWQTAVDRARTSWQDCERRARSFGVLNERRAEKARVVTARREQKQTDEFAARFAASAWSRA